MRTSGATPPSPACLLLLLFLLVVGGCADSGTPESTAASVEDSAGVRVVTSPPDRVMQRLDREVAIPAHLRLGVVEGAEELQFTAPNGAARLSDGRLVVSESGNRLRLFDQDGRFERWIGAVGEGPREFQVVSSLGVLEGDTIAVYDGRRRRIVLFEPGGDMVREATVQLPDPFVQVSSSQFLPDGRLFVVGGSVGFNPAESDERQERVAAILLSPEGEDPQILAEADGMLTRLERVGGGEGGQVMMIMASLTPFFHPLPRFTGSPDGVYQWDGARFEVRRMDHTGVLQQVARVHHPADPVTPGVIRTFREEGPGSNVSPQLQAIREEAMASRMYADSLPHFQVAHPDPSGGLWLGAFMGHVGGTPTRWWRIAPDGEVAGTLELPEGFRVLAFAVDEVFGVERDELDVPFVVAYRLR